MVEVINDIAESVVYTQAELENISRKCSDAAVWFRGIKTGSKLTLMMLYNNGFLSDEQLKNIQETFYGQTNRGKEK